MVVSDISDGDEDDEAFDDDSDNNRRPFNDDHDNDRMQTTETFLSAGTTT